VTNVKSVQDPIIIETRDELIFLLSEAAALEHMIMCGYLYTSFTLKDRPDEGLSPAQSEAIKRWNGVIMGVATQEMLHLAVVNNLLTSIGAAPYFGRPNFPHPARYFAPQVQLALLPFGEKALRHFLYLERPESSTIEDTPGLDPISAAVPNTVSDELVPEAQAYSSVGDLYRGLEGGLAHLAEKLGERRLFVGSVRSQATPEYFGWPELVPITDMGSAKRAIDTIIIEGEGARGHWKNAHFGKFYGVLNDYLEFKRQDPGFEPARPVIPACAKPPADMRKMAKIADPFTAGVSNLFSASYELALQLLCRFFMHTDTTGKELQVLSNSAVMMMAQVLSPLGKLLTTLPVGEYHPGRTAGPTFEMYQKEYLLPHREAAWILLHERITEQADYCRALAGRAPAGFDLTSVQSSLEELSSVLEPHALASRRAVG
jgi:hypothetical protein